MASLNNTHNPTVATKVIYEYCVLRYVADIEREEFINVGMLMMCKRYKWLRAEVFIDEPRINSCFTGADIPLLRNQITAFTRDDVPEKGIPVEERYRWLAAVKSAVIQTSCSHPGILIMEDTVTAEQVKYALTEKFNTLFNRLVK